VDRNQILFAFFRSAVATNADVPVIDVYFVEKPDFIFNPVGARGIGEIGVTGIPAAIANAIYNATGTRVREFPVSPEKLMRREQPKGVI
jgi:xanthine dehydrogenase YagR molybdenum-binding subunit